MFIKPGNTEIISEHVAAAIGGGNDWVVYETGVFVDEASDLHFFKTKADAAQFINSNTSDLDQFDMREAKPLHNALEDIKAMDTDISAVGYFFIDSYYTVADTPLQLMSSSVPLVPVDRIEQQMSEYPIVEIRNETGNLSLLEELRNRELCWITLERTIVPADHIAEFSVVYNQYPSGTRYETGHTFKDLAIYKDQDTALSGLKDLVNKFLSPGSSGVDELLLIGKYGGKKLELDYEGTPLSNSGYLIATANCISLGEETPEYEIHFSKDPYHPVVVQDTFQAQYNGSSKQVEFLNKEGDKTNIDSAFWRKEFIASDNLTSLKKLLEALAFPPQVFLDAKEKIGRHPDQFAIYTEKLFEQDQMSYTLQFNKNQTGFYYLSDYTAMLNRAIQFQNISVNGINLKELENSMQRLDWSKAMHQIKDQRTISAMKGVISRLEKLDVLNASYMKAKFWSGTPFGTDPQQNELFALIHASNQYKETFPFAGRDTIKVNESYELLTSVIVKTVEANQVVPTEQKEKQQGFGTKKTDNNELLPKVNKGKGTGNKNDTDDLLPKNREGTGKKVNL